MKRLTSIALTFGLAVFAVATGSMLKVLGETYKFPSDSDAAKAKCSLCHVSKMGGKLNPYGTDLKTALKGSKVLTGAIVHSVDGKDSDGDGIKNGDELKAGKNPGVK